MVKKVSKCPVCDKKFTEHSLEDLVECMNETNLKSHNPEPTEASAFNLANELRLLDTFGQPGADKRDFSIAFHNMKEPVVTRKPANAIFAFMLATMVKKEKKVELTVTNPDAKRTDTPETLEK